MIEPIIPNELFRVNPDIKPYMEDDVVYIDDYYADYEKVYECLQNQYVPRWKWGEGTKNFVNYYDCRPRIANGKPTQLFAQEMANINTIIKHFWKEDRELHMAGSDYEFNYTKHIKNLPPSNDWAFHPHADANYASIIYLDKVCSGGTALYPDIKHLVNTEHNNLFSDTSKYRKKIIWAKPNRHIIFKATNYHGGYMHDHKEYLNDWRINQVWFYNIKGHDFQYDKND